MQTKICSKCGEVKELSEFSKDKGKKDGIRSTCKVCAKESMRKYREANTEKAKESYRKWYKANPEKVKENTRKWQEANPDKVKESKRKWREANLEKVNEKHKKWQEANPDKVKEKNRKYRENCPDSYVRKNLIQAGIPSEEIIPELIEIKRTIIKIKRKLKWKTQE